MPKKQKIYTYHIATALILGLVICAIWLGTRDSKDTAPAASPEPSTLYSPAIPRSKPEAQTFIDQAAESAQKGDYKKAMEITEDAIKEFPDDENLRLNRDMYQLKAVQNGQM